MMQHHARNQILNAQSYSHVYASKILNNILVYDLLSFIITNPSIIIRLVYYSGSQISLKITLTNT